jgi:predicted acyltransferase
MSWGGTAMADVARTGQDQDFRPGPPAVEPIHSRVSYDRQLGDPAAHDGDQWRATSVTFASDSAVGRVTSVDALRGFAMFWIIAGDSLAWALHNLSSGKDGLLSAATAFLSEQLMHVPWEGLHFYDFLFPLFVFVTGVSIPFSLPRLVAHKGKWAAYERVLRRSLLLFALGLIYYGGASNIWPEIRLLGVLQRIALCYLFASLLFLHLDVRGLMVAFVSLLVGYWALMTFVPVPEVGAGSFAEDVNLARWIDAQYLPGLRFYDDWDPEGLLSTLPAIASCLLGVFAGLLLKETRLEPTQKVAWFIGAGTILVAVGFLWGLQFPVVKKIWTSSFVLVAGGYSILLLGMFYLLIDVWGHKAKATIFLWIGANAIVLYMMNNIVGFQSLAGRLVGGEVARFLDVQLTKGAGSFVIVAVGLVLAIMLAGFLYRRRIFLRA